MSVYMWGEGTVICTPIPTSTSLFTNQVTCFAYEGIDAIKAALQAGLDTPTNSEVEIKLIAPPMCVRPLVVHLGCAVVVVGSIS